MNIVEKMQSIIKSFPELPDLSSLHTDIAEDIPESYSLISTGDEHTGADIIGNEKRQHSFLFAAVWQAQSDFDRLYNSGMLLHLTRWIEENAKGQTFETSEKKEGKITEIRCGNGMLYAIPETVNDGVQYQLQIICAYKIKTQEV